MSIEGLISTSVLFHDKDGTTTIKVVNLSSVKGYTTGKVAIVSGTIGTSLATIECSPMNPEYLDAAGDNVSFGTVTRVAFQSDRLIRVEGGTVASAQKIVESDGDVSVSRFVSSGGFGSGPLIYLQPGYTSGTASYSIVIYGT